MFDIDDHRSLGQRLDLWHFEDDAPGMVFWHPRGFVLYRLLEQAARARLAADGYAEVRSPRIRAAAARVRARAAVQRCAPPVFS